MKLSTSLLLPIAVSVLCGCEGLKLFERLPNTKKYTTENHLLPDKVASGSDGFFPEYDASFNAEKKNSDISLEERARLAEAYIKRGVNLNRTLCFEYLDRLSSYNNHKSFIREGWLATTVLATGLLAIERGTSKDIQRVALGSTFGLTMVDQFANHYLLGPDSDAVVELVHKALDAAEVKINNDMARDFDGAYTQLHDYANICTSTSIRRLVRGSIETATPVVMESTSANYASTDQLKTEIESAIQNRSVTDEQIAILYWATHGGTDQKYEVFLKQELQRIYSLDAQAFLGGNEKFKAIKAIFSSQPMKVRMQLDKQLAFLKSVAEKSISDKKSETGKTILTDSERNQAIQESVIPAIPESIQGPTTTERIRVEIK